jgi:hypothetical protein
MSEFLIYFQIGLKHVLDIHAYDHVLFLIALVVPFSFKDWKRIILLITLTIGTVALLLSVFGIIAVKVNVVELIPITILITAFFNLFTAGKSKKESINLIFLSLFFGIIHGLDFLIILKRSLWQRHIKVIAFGRICCGN